MRIGIVPTLDRSAGGVFQYSLTFMDALYTLCEQKLLKDEFILFIQDKKSIDLSKYRELGWGLSSLDPLPNQAFQVNRLFRRKIRKILGNTRPLKMFYSLKNEVLPMIRRRNPDLIIYSKEYDQLFSNKRIELMLYPNISRLSFETRIPYVMAVHDLQHRLHPEFPEVSANGELQKREYYFRNGIRSATLILVDSEIGKEDVLNFYGSYGISPERIKVLPFLPASYLSNKVAFDEIENIRKIYNLSDRYLFYPAQFWPHKNHIGIIKALKILKETYGLKPNIVFVGSYTGEIRKRVFKEVMSSINRFAIENQVHYLGYVPEQDMSALYAGAVGLIMPTFFGPTNIPVLEAWAFGCPVLTSDIRGIREQTGDAAILVDPSSEEAIAEGIYRLWTDEQLRQKLIRQGRQRLSNYTPDDFRQRLARILEEGKRISLESKSEMQSIIK